MTQPRNMTRRAAQQALVDAINTARDTKLATARAAYLAEHGVEELYPVDGSVLSRCRLDDPRDLSIRVKQDEGDRPVRHLVLNSSSARPDDYVGNDGGEATHDGEIEWTIITPAAMPLDAAQALFDRGIAELADVLEPLMGPYLRNAEGDVVALDFDLRAADFVNADIGDRLVFGVFISLYFLLDTPSILR